MTTLISFDFILSNSFIQTYALKQTIPQFHQISFQHSSLIFLLPSSTLILVPPIILCFIVGHSRINPLLLPAPIPSHLLKIALGSRLALPIAGLTARGANGALAVDF